MRASLFDLKTGDRIMRIPLKSASWSKDINGWGRISATLPRTPTARLQSLRTTARPWRTILALTRGDRVVHSGPVTARPFKDRLELKAEGFGAAFRKRLVLNHALASMTIDGSVLIDEDNPAPHWQLNLLGSLPDIAADLVDETLKWGPLPVTTSAREGGLNTRTYYGYDFATVEERLLDLTKVEGGPELRFRDELTDSGIWYELEADDELIATHHQWNTNIPGQGVVIEGMDDDGDALVTQQWMIGGKNADIMLITRANGVLPDYPLLQAADTSHSSVSEIGTLRSYAAEAILRGARTQDVVDITVPATNDVQPGDWADVRTSHALYGDVVLPLKVVGVSGTTGPRLTASCRIRNGEEF